MGLKLLKYVGAVVGLIALALLGTETCAIPSIPEDAVIFVNHDGTEYAYEKCVDEIGLQNFSKQKSADDIASLKLKRNENCDSLVRQFYSEGKQCKSNLSTLIFGAPKSKLNW
jgi:hypothetical protein